MFSTCFEMRFPLPFESSVGAFKNAFGYSSALSNAYSTLHNNTLYYLQKKKKKIHDDRNKPTKAIRHEA
jgi:hypothetical protein